MRPEIQRIAIANPDHAPYGLAAAQALQTAGVWEAVQPKLVFGENVRQTLQYAETGNVDVAIVALSLSRARGSGGGSEPGRWTLIPQDLHPPLDQALAVIKGTPHEAAAARLRGVRQRSAGPADHAQVRLRPARARNRPNELAPAPAVAAGHGRRHGADGGGRAAAGPAAGAAAVPRAPRWWRRWSCCPLVLPPTVVGYYLLLALGRGSPIDDWFGWRILFTWGAAAIASAVVGLPLLVQSARAAIAGVDPALEHAARTLGSSELEVLWRVTLPLARRGILAGLVLAAARALGEFGATLMVAGNIPGRTQTLPLAIYDAVQNRHYAQANGDGAADDGARLPEPVGRAPLRAAQASAHSVPTCG